MCSTKSAAVTEVLAAAAGTGTGTGEEIVALTELIDQAQAALVERVAAFDVEQGWEADGAYSFASWLRARADVSRSDASCLHRFTRTLRTMPATEAAVREGKLSVAKARVLAEVINPRTRERFDEQETFLIDQLQGLDLDAARTVARYWKRLADPDGPTDLDNLCLVCNAHHHLIHDHGWNLHPQADGTWHLTRPDGSTVDPPRRSSHQRPPGSPPAATSPAAPEDP